MHKFIITFRHADGRYEDFEVEDYSLPGAEEQVRYKNMYSGLITASRYVDLTELEHSLEKQ